MKQVIKYSRIIILMIGVLMISTTSFSQCEDCPPPDGWGDESTDVPFDGGVSLLVATAIGYGARKAHAEKKRKKEMAKKHF